MIGVSTQKSKCIKIPKIISEINIICILYFTNLLTTSANRKVRIISTTAKPKNL